MASHDYMIILPLCFRRQKKMASRQETIPWLTSYLHWTFRASFFAVVVTDFIAFFFLCWAWACAIYVGALVNPRCFVSGGTTLSEIEDWQQEFYFQDAFQLSWTTFSTVVSTCLLALPECRHSNFRFAFD